MPANLNALVRYKTINSCLFGGRRRWSIDELREKCSEALAESRGIYTGVAERTLRDDLRVMRSDILGFNAPIRQEGGLYFYSDPKYSILTLSVTDAGLAEQIYDLLIRMRSQGSHPELEIILQRLCELLGREYEPCVVKKSMEKTFEETTMLSESIKLHRLYHKQLITDSDLLNYNYLIKDEEMYFNQDEPGQSSAGDSSRMKSSAEDSSRRKSSGTASRRRPPQVLWGNILDLFSYKKN